MHSSHRNDKATRMFEFAQLISRYPRKYTAGALAQRLNVTKRTIHRYVQALEKMGYRVESEPSGGYFIMQHIHTIPPHLAIDEQLALVLMPSVVGEITSDERVSALYQAYLSALEKMENSLQDNTMHGALDTLAHRIIIDKSEKTTVRETSWEVLIQLLDSIRQNITVNIEYHSLSSSSTTWRMFDPYYLVPHNNALYIFGYCHLREDYRTFRINRINLLEKTDKHFILENLSFDDYQGAAWGIDQSGETAEVTLQFEPCLTEYVLEEVPHQRLLFQQTDDSRRLIICVQTRVNPEFIRFVLQFGGGVQVLSPHEVRDVVQENARAMLGFYENNEKN